MEPPRDSVVDATSDSTATQPTLHGEDVSTNESHLNEPARQSQPNEPILHEADAASTNNGPQPNEPILHEAHAASTNNGPQPNEPKLEETDVSSTFQEAECATKEPQSELAIRLMAGAGVDSCPSFDLALTLVHEMALSKTPPSPSFVGIRCTNSLSHRELIASHTAGTFQFVFIGARPSCCTSCHFPAVRVGG